MKQILFNSLKFLLVIVMAICILQIFFIYPLEGVFETYYKKRFTSIPDVLSIENYMNYEGTRSMDIVLNDQIKIDVWSNEYFSFMGNGWVGLTSIGGLTLDCRKIKNNSVTGVGINAISFVNNSPLNLKIHSVEDLVKNHKVIYDYIASFPVAVEDSKLVKMDNLIEKDSDHWCHLENSDYSNFVKELKKNSL